MDCCSKFKFDGYNYNDWVDKMKYLLISLGVFYVLDPNLTPIPENPIPEPGNEDVIFDLEKQRMARKEDEALCYKFIKKSLSDRLFDLYVMPVADPISLWNTLKEIFTPKGHVENRHLVVEYLKFQMIEGRSVFNQVCSLQGLVDKLNQQSICIPEAFQIGAILAKLPPSWKTFSEEMMIKPDDYSLSFLLKCIHEKEMGIQESSRSEKKTKRDSQPRTRLGVKRNQESSRSVKKTARDSQPRTMLGVKRNQESSRSEENCTRQSTKNNAGS